MRIGCPPHLMTEPSDPSEKPHTFFEPADVDRPASATPTEPQLERETPTIARLDRSPPPPRHDPVTHRPDIADRASIAGKENNIGPRAANDGVQPFPRPHFQPSFRRRRHR